jgi:hypothetical protein
MFWLVRNYQTKEALGVFKADKIETGRVEAPNGVHIAKIVEHVDDTYTVSKRVEGRHVRHVWMDHSIIEPITEAEYHTYKAFDLFEF